MLAHGTAAPAHQHALQQAGGPPLREPPVVVQPCGGEAGGFDVAVDHLVARRESPDPGGARHDDGGLPGCAPVIEQPRQIHHRIADGAQLPVQYRGQLAAVDQDVRQPVVAVHDHRRVRRDWLTVYQLGADRAPRGVVLAAGSHPLPDLADATDLPLHVRCRRRGQSDDRRCHLVQARQRRDHLPAQGVALIRGQLLGVGFTLQRRAGDTSHHEEHPARAGLAGAHDRRHRHLGAGQPRDDAGLPMYVVRAAAPGAARRFTQHPLPVPCVTDQRGDIGLAEADPGDGDGSTHRLTVLRQPVRHLVGPAAHRDRRLRNRWSM